MKQTTWEDFIDDYSHFDYCLLDFRSSNAVCERGKNV